MVQSVLSDIKGQFQYGHMISRIILVNVSIFFVIVLIRAFTPGGGSSESFQNLLGWLALSSESIGLLKKPWTLISHMFLHEGVWHLVWNMLMLFWFGRIVGDLIGDKRILPIYLLGGLCGAFFYLTYASITGVYGIAYGASAAVMAFVVASGFLAPEYNMRLILLGNVKLKYIVIVLVLLDLIMISEANNTGGRLAHLGGAIFGGLYVFFLRSGRDMTAPVTNMTNWMQQKNRPSRMKVTYRKESEGNRSVDLTVEERIDQILDKINESGFDSLTTEEKDFLAQASKK